MCRRRAALSSSVGSAANIFPGFMIILGSNARLIRRCASTTCFIFPIPTPCSPLAAPPYAIARAITLSFNFISFASSSGAYGIKQWKFPSLMCAHMTHGKPAALKSASVSDTHAASLDVGTHTSPT
eukprot:29225-Pelagococcus_subviridis.AAC.3